jgi:hypothetical protein
VLDGLLVTVNEVKAELNRRKGIEERIEEIAVTLDGPSTNDVPCPTRIIGTEDIGKYLA